MENRLALVIVVDGLRAASLGAYGNTSFPTPGLDELSSKCLTVEWLLADSPTVDGFYRSVWSGQAPLDTFLPKALHQQGVRQWFITDSQQIGGQIDCSFFDEVVLLEQGKQHTAEEIKETHAAQFFADVIERLAVWKKDADTHTQSGLLWIHFSGLCGPWDAPLEMRSDFLDDEDPLPPQFVCPPDSIETEDLDELLGYRVAYAAQVAVLEACLAGLVEAFVAIATDAKHLAVLTSPRGYSLGEHRCVGSSCRGLYSEQMHLPLLLMSEETAVPLPRVAGFAQPTDLGATLREWYGTTETDRPWQGISMVPFLLGNSSQLRDVAVATGPQGEKTIRTPAWLLHEGDNVELFAKPDDQWEANDVSSRCPDIVQSLKELLAECLHDSNGRQVLPKILLSEELVSVWR